MLLLVKYQCCKEQTGLNKIVGQLGTNIYTKFYSIKKIYKKQGTKFGLMIKETFLKI